MSKVRRVPAWTFEAQGGSADLKMSLWAADNLPRVSRGPESFAGLLKKEDPMDQHFFEELGAISVT